VDGVTLLREARHAGLRVEARDGQLVVSGPRRLEAVVRRLIEAKPSILDAIESDVAWRVEVMRTQMTTQGQVPLLIARPGHGIEPGTCCSCGDDLADDERYRCRLCVTAAVTVLAEAS
jgi:hypothetical protein